MAVRLSETLRFLEDFCSSPGMAAEDRRRRGYFALCILIIIPALAGYVAVDLTQGRLAEALTACALMVILAALLVLLPRSREVRWIFRVAVSLAVGLILYFTATGGGDGLVFIWFYTFPLIVFFLFGRREGAVWVLASFAVLLLLFFGDLGAYSYDPAVAVRFMTTYGIVSVLGFGLEASRRRYYEELLAEKTSLEDALADVKTLSGLLPICASCKSVRDDQGYWSQIETYIQQHSEAELSRGLCPDCRERTALSTADSQRGSHASAVG